MLYINFCLKIWLSVLFWIIDEPFHFLFAIFNILMIGIVVNIFNCGVMGFLGVLIPVSSFHDIVESIFSFPFSLVFLFFFDLDFIFIHQWKSQTKILFRVGIKFGWIQNQLLSHLFLLKFPNIEFLVSIHKHINSFRNLESFLQRFSLAERFNSVQVGNFKILSVHL